MLYACTLLGLLATFVYKELANEKNKNARPLTVLYSCNEPIFSPVNDLVGMMQQAHNKFTIVIWYWVGWTLKSGIYSVFRYTLKK